ncbi:hypothetical protein Smp_182410 [Schistosoma mansoni]|uniref:hypothetical protein n=2 Tax=Schistosoma mansoni TaxID=6183 RepID=UPI00019B34C3|nr:hypothetical protein Smp_182410 [Schistosoma mansoni]|eukprot:XP_018644981.1 hypothetical protein Smp_182410 [Schistosoma mansoni]
MTVLLTGGYIISSAPVFQFIDRLVSGLVDWSRCLLVCEVVSLELKTDECVSSK